MTTFLCVGKYVDFVIKDCDGISNLLYMHVKLLFMVWWFLSAAVIIKAFLMFFFKVIFTVQPSGLSCCRVFVHFQFTALIRFRELLLTFFFFSQKTGLFEIWLNLGQALVLLYNLVLSTELTM